MKRVLISLIVSIAAVSPAVHASSLSISFLPFPAAVDAGQIVELVAVVSDGQAAVSAAPVAWQSIGQQGSVVVADAVTDASGRARAVVRGYDSGTETITASLDEFGCSDACATAIIELKALHQACAGDAFALGVFGAPAGGDQFAATASGYDCSGSDGETVAEEGDASALSAQYESFGPTRSEARVAQIPVPLAAPFDSFSIEGADASAQTDCGIDQEASIELHGSLAQLSYFGEPLARGESPPNTVIEIPGVARITLNEQEQIVDGNTASGSVNVARIQLDAGPEAIIAHAAASTTCAPPPEIVRIPAVEGDAHEDEATGTVHLRLDATADPAGGDAFLGLPVQFSDARDVGRAPFTCYNGIPSSLVEVPVEEDGRMRVRLTGSITCAQLMPGTHAFDFMLDVEDIATSGPPDLIHMVLSKSGIVVYDESIMTTDGNLYVFER